MSLIDSNSMMDPADVTSHILKMKQMLAARIKARAKAPTPDMEVDDVPGSNPQNPSSTAKNTLNLGNKPAVYNPGSIVIFLPNSSSNLFRDGLD